MPRVCRTLVNFAYTKESQILLHSATSPLSTPRLATNHMFPLPHRSSSLTPRPLDITSLLRTDPSVPNNIPPLSLATPEDLQQLTKLRILRLKISALAKRIELLTSLAPETFGDEVALVYNALLEISMEKVAYGKLRTELLAVQDELGIESDVYECMFNVLENSGRWLDQTQSSFEQWVGEQQRHVRECVQLQMEEWEHRTCPCAVCDLFHHRQSIVFSR